MNDNISAYLRAPKRTLAEAKAQRFADFIREVQDRASRQFPDRKPSVATTLFADGTAVIRLSDYMASHEERFGGFSTPLADALAELESWLASDPVGDGWRTLGCDRTGTRIVEQARSSCDACDATDRPTATVIGEMIEQLRRLAWHRLGKQRIRPKVTLGPVPGGWLVSIEYDHALHEFDGNTLSCAYRAAMAWATGTRIVEGEE
jgi:hypothetical protein